jgi:hypothetical protein
MKNEILYATAAHLIMAVQGLKQLREQEEFINQLIDKAEELKNKIVINQGEIDKIGEYKKQI